MLGTQDLVIGLVIALFFFGAKRLPEMARSLGKSMQEFKKGVSGDTGGEEPVTPATPPPAVATTAPQTCGSCQAPLEQNGSIAPAVGPPPRAGPRQARNPRAKSIAARPRLRLSPRR